MSKVYAKEVAPEFRTSPFWEDEDERGFYEHTTILDFDKFVNIVISSDLFNLVADNAFDAMDAIDDPYPYADYAEYLRETFNPSKELTKSDVSRLRTLFAKFENCAGYPEYMPDVIADIMTILSGEKYISGVLRGVVQRECVTIIYKADEWNDEALDALEKEYWNNGTEYHITFADDKTFCLSMYFVTDDKEEIRKEIASECGVEPEEVEMDTYF